ncbi:MAG: hypothetical protein O3B86_05490 [Planctomycetota bacterium]|nr:hypothetical protein [Planctomycetota bacterium]
MLSFRRFLPMLVAVVVALTVSSRADAQPSLPDSATAEAGTGATSTTPAASAKPLADPPGPLDIVVFVDENGEVLRVRAGGQISEYLKWREQLLDTTTNDLPGYYVAAISLMGEVAIDRAVAKLDVSIEVFVKEGIGQVDVPLRLNEATLLLHRRTRSNSVEFIPTEKGGGMKCRIMEAGQHRIDLQILVPIRKTGNSNRLQLSLPGTAQSSLRLTVPGDAVTVRPEQLGDVEVRALPDSHSELIVHGLGAAIDLPWQVLDRQQEARTEIQVETLIAADAGIDGLSLDAVQTITATRGSFNKATIQLPQGFDVLSVSSSTHESLTTSNLQSSPVVVTLQEATAGPVRLKWLLSASASSATDRFSIGGFNVENAARQETLLGISVAEGFRLGQLLPRPQLIQRIRTSSFRKRVETQFDPQIEFQQAYRLPGRTSRVEFELERIEPSYRVSPSYDLLLRVASAELSAGFQVIVYRGSLDHVRLNWPGFRTQGWHQIEVVKPAERVHVSGVAPGDSGPSSDVGPGSAGMSDEITLQFSEALNRTHGKVTDEVQARRPIQLGDESFPISFPTVDGDFTPVSKLTIRNANDVENTMMTVDGTSVRAVLDGFATTPAHQIRTPLNLSPRLLESTSRSLMFEATVTTHPQDVATTSRATLTLDDEWIAIEQRLHYSVVYKELDRLRILVPAAVRSAEFWLVGEDETPSVPLKAEDGGPEFERVRQIRLNLPEPRLGQFDVMCSYSIAVPPEFAGSGKAMIDVPLLQPTEGPGHTTRVEIRSPGNVGVQLKDALWSQELTLGKSPSWIASGAVRNVGLTLEAAPERATQNFVVRRSALQTRFQSGAARTRGVYLIDGDISFLTITLPAHSDQSSLSVWWDGNLLEKDRLVYPRTAASLDTVPTNEVRASETDVRILVDGMPNREKHILALEYVADQNEGFTGINKLQLQAPRFASDVWLAETMWDVVLPFDQHLVVYPQDYTPRFSWQRQAIVWSRRPVDGNLALADWLLDDLDPEATSSLKTQLQELPFDTLATVTYGNSYRFGTFGHQREVTLQTMSQPAVILAGAGLALAVGLVLLRIPGTQHVLTILVVGFGLSLAGLWHLEAVQLLLQPALFGLLLAVAASAIESRVKRRQRASLVTFSSPSDFLVPGSSREEIIHDESKAVSERLA